MNDISLVAIFCEDIRQEVAGTETIVGVFPDNIHVPGEVGTFPKMCVYVRMHLHPDFNPGSITTRIVLPDGTEISRSEVQPSLLEQARANAKSSGSTYAGLISRFVISPLHVKSAGRIRAIVHVGDKEYVAGALNLRLVPPGSN